MFFEKYLFISREEMDNIAKVRRVTTQNDHVHIVLNLNLWPNQIRPVAC